MGLDGFAEDEVTPGAPSWKRYSYPGLEKSVDDSQ